MNPTRPRTTVVALGCASAAALLGHLLKALSLGPLIVGLYSRRRPRGSPPNCPRVAQLPGLAASFGNTGLFVAVTTEGEPGPLSAGADVAAYRTVQEALTNATRHAAVHGPRCGSSTG